MSREQARALVRRFFDAFNAGDHAAMLDCLDEDVVHDTDSGKREIGREKFRWHLAEGMRHFRESWDDAAIMTDEGGTRAAVEFTRRGRYLETAEGLPPATGQAYAVRAGFFLEIDGDRIGRVSECLDRDAWIAGLRES
jgi:steroid delta-isomerase-like uncharacterized protein